MIGRNRGKVLAGLLVALSCAPALCVQEAPPAPAPRDTGAVVELRAHRLSGVTSAWLKNGVLVHHREMNSKAGVVILRVMIAGGPLLETAQTHGVSEAAASVWAHPGTRTVSADEIDTRLKRAGVSLRSYLGDEGFVLEFGGSTKGMDEALPIVRLLLTEPKVETEAIAQRAEAARIAENVRRCTMQGIVGRALEAALLADDEGRGRSVSPEDMARHTSEAAQVWLDLMLRSGPIEASIVGDLPLGTAMEWSVAALGSLPARARISPATYAMERKLKLRADLAAGPIEVTTKAGCPSIGQQIPQRAGDGAPDGDRNEKEGKAGPNACVVLGFGGANARDLADHRALILGARVLSRRLNERCGRSADAFAASQSALSYPGYGVVFSAARCAPEGVGAMRATLEREMELFLQNGPEVEELRKAVDAQVPRVQALLNDPAYWGLVLAGAIYHGYSVDEIAGADVAYQNITAAAIKDTWARYDTPGTRIRVTVLPGE